MPHPPCPHTPTQGALAASDLERLAEHLVGGHDTAAGDAEASPDGAALVRARRHPAGIDLALRPLPAHVHPADALLGHVVPGLWSVAGIIAPATARTLDGGSGAMAPRAISVSVLIGRNGTVATCARDRHEGRTLALDEVPTGRLVDLLQRALGRPTPPPDAGPCQLWQALWLDAVVAGAAGAEHGGALAPELAAALSDTASPEGPAGWAHLRGLACAPDAAAGRTDAALATALTTLVEPAHAAWMDDGCFARWVLSALPSPEDLLDAVDALLPPARARAVRHALGLNDASPGDADR